MSACSVAGRTRKDTSPRALKPGRVRLTPNLPSIGTNEKFLELNGANLDMVPVEGRKATSRSGWTVMMIS